MTENLIFYPQQESEEVHRISVEQVLEYRLPRCKHRTEKRSRHRGGGEADFMQNSAKSVSLFVTSEDEGMKYLIKKTTGGLVDA